MAGIFGSGGDIQAAQTTVDPAVDKRITDITDNASQSVGNIQQTAMRGVNANLSGQEQADQHQLSLGQNDPGTSTAIRSRYQTLMNNDLDSMQRQSVNQSYDTKEHQLQQAFGVAHARNQVNLDNYKRSMAAYNANMKARAQAISSVFQMAGTVAAVALTGGAAAPALAGGLIAGGAGDAGGAQTGADAAATA